MAGAVELALMRRAETIRWIAQIINRILEKSESPQMIGTTTIFLVRLGCRSPGI